MREYFLKCGTSTTMQSPEMLQNYPDTEGVMTISAAILKAAGFDDRDVRFRIYH